MNKKNKGRPKGKFKPVKTSLGNLIRTYRTNLGLGLLDVALKMGVTGHYLSNIERGKSPLPIEHLFILADYLNIPHIDLFNEAIKQTAYHKKYTSFVETLKDNNVK